MGRSINREVRVLPIDRVAHTAADIDHLREEFEMMTRDAVPLIWSSNDIQTLINSWIEDMEKQRCLFSGWQREFDTIDGDGDRKLTWKECKAKGMLEKTFKLADADGNGYIDLAEYEAWFTVRQYQKSCRAMFTRLEERIEEHAAKDPPEPLPADDKAEAKEFVNRIRSELEKTVAHAEGDVRKLLTAHAERDVRKRLRQLESLTR